MSAIALAAVLLTVAYAIVWWLNRPDRAALPDTKERREIEIRREIRDRT